MQKPSDFVAGLFDDSGRGPTAVGGVALEFVLGYATGTKNFHVVLSTPIFHTPFS
jgi:hypothetical protein